MIVQADDFPSLWAKRVNQGNIDAILNLYSQNFILMPTFSPHAITTTDKLQDYFTQLAAKDDMQVHLHDKTIACQQTGEHSYVLTGIYSFQFKVDGALLTFPSRFTFVVNLSQENPILHHHSSQVPRNLS